LITIFECRRRMPSQADVMAALHTPDDPSVLRNATVLERTVVDSLEVTASLLHLQNRQAKFHSGGAALRQRRG
jgi:hypothetical protein